MKNMLMIANQFPPMGGPGVQRSYKFVKFMGEFGYKPVVLTRTEGNNLVDYSLLKEVANHDIVRTKSYDFTELPGVLSLAGKFVSRYIMIPDGEYLWAKKSYTKAANLIKDKEIDVIYTTSYPYSDHLLGLKLKKQFPDIPWVVDFRDEWTNNPFTLEKKMPKYRRNKEKQMEKAVVQNCDAFITNTTYMLDGFLKDYPFLKNKAYVINNGFDDADFDKLDITHEYKDFMTITYAGGLYERRHPYKIFAALRNLIKKGKIASDEIKIRLIGSMKVDKIKAAASHYSIERNVTCESYLPHEEAISALLEADVLLLLIGDGKGACNFSSGKIFEYINCNRPILGVCPPVGAAADIIKETNSGVIADTADVHEIEKGILELYTRWKQKDLIRECNKEAVSKYHRRQLTKKLVEICNKVI